MASNVIRALTVVQLVVELSVPPVRRENALVALQSIMRPARLDRRCASACVWCDPENGHALLYMEEWAEAVQFELEMRGERIGRLLELVEVATMRPRIEVRSIGDVRGLDYIAAVRAEGHPAETAAGASHDAIDEKVIATPSIHGRTGHEDSDGS